MICKNEILAVVCSLVFVMSCSACGGKEQEVLLIGQQEAGQGVSRAGYREAGQSGSASGAEPGILPEEETVREVYVYVCGAVKVPGVVSLPEGSRTSDALEAAGGFTPEAAQEAVNLAAKVSDGEKIYFPTWEEHAAQARQEEDDAAGLVNINTADVSRLCTLPGIGESRAADIIAYRESQGDFTACEDIMQVPGIKESVYSKISGRITVK